MLLDCLTAVQQRWGHRFIVSTHPRTRKRLEELDGFTATEGIDFMEPFGFHDYNSLQMNAACVLSDSGTISEESSILGFPAVTLRDSIERPEALDTGAIVMTGLERENVVDAVEAVVRDVGTVGADGLPSGYEVIDTSHRVLRFILSTAARHLDWSGIRPSGR